MTKILVVDNNPYWHAQCCKWRFDCSDQILPDYELYVISSQLVKQIDLPKRFIVVTGQETIAEARDIYNLGALDYFERDFGDTGRNRILENLGVT